MRRPQFPGKRYIGNYNKKEVHDLDQEDISASGCQINEIITSSHTMVFNPDTLEEAHARGYDNCAKCLGESLR